VSGRTPCANKEDLCREFHQSANRVDIHNLGTLLQKLQEKSPGMEGGVPLPRELRGGANQNNQRDAGNDSQVRGKHRRGEEGGTSLLLTEMFCRGAKRRSFTALKDQRRGAQKPPFRNLPATNFTRLRTRRWAYEWEKKKP